MVHFPIKNVNKDAICPINVMSLKFNQLQHRPHIISKKYIFMWITGNNISSSFFLFVCSIDIFLAQIRLFCNMLKLGPGLLKSGVPSYKVRYIVLCFFILNSHHVTSSDLILFLSSLFELNIKEYWLKNFHLILKVNLIHY